jgi:isopentenyl-diphosphate delta-isomerase
MYSFCLLLTFIHHHSPWGEHEIDYVLFVVVPSKSAITLKPHPDEVDDTKWVSKKELEDMMQDPNLLFSPWFRIICKKWLLSCWWNDLNETMTTDKHCDYVNIHEFDPPTEHLGGSGKAGPLFVQGDVM